MRNLIDFFVRYSSWILYLLYVVICCILLFDRNPFQHHVFMTSAGGVSSTLYDATNSVTSYFNLREINDDLQRQNARLESELLAMRSQLENYQERYYGDTMTVDEPMIQCDFIIARAINNSIHRPKNYITINKGRLDSIRPEMGIVDQNGVVGIVNIVTDNYARAISVLNPDFSLQCKVKGNDAFGSLVWDGKDYREAILQEIPRHTVYEQGDTIVTSGHSAIFPEGIPVGTIIGDEKTIDDNFRTLRIRLFTDFSRLSTVRVISNAHLNELKEVEKDSNSTDKK